MRFIGLLMIAGVIGFSNDAEGWVPQEQNLDGGQGVIWVKGGIGSEVPENAIRVRIGDGWPLCRGTLAEERGQENFWLDIGVVNPKEEGNCHTLRAKKTLRLQENFYYLVPAETEGEVSMEGMFSEADLQVQLAEATAQLELDLEAASEKAQFYHDKTQGMVPESDVEARIAEATEGMVPAADIEAAVRAAEIELKAQMEQEVEGRIAEAMEGMVPAADIGGRGRRALEAEQRGAEGHDVAVREDDILDAMGAEDNGLGRMVGIEQLSQEEPLLTLEEAAAAVRVICGGTDPWEDCEGLYRLNLYEFVTTY